MDLRHRRDRARCRPSRSWSATCSTATRRPTRRSRSMPRPARRCGRSIPGISGSGPNRGVMYWASGRRAARLRGGRQLRLCARCRRPASRSPTFGQAGRIDLREDLGRDPPDAGRAADDARRHLQGSDDRRRARRRRPAGVAGRHSRLRRAHRRAALDVPHDSASRASSATNMAEARVGVQRRRQQLGRHGGRRARAASSTCRRDRRPAISTAPIGSATTCSPTRCSRWTPRPASGSGISRPCTTTSGIAISRRRRGW